MFDVTSPSLLSSESAGPTPNVLGVHRAFCLLANMPTSAAHLAQVVRIAARSVDADIGSITVTSSAGMTILTPFNFTVDTEFSPWSFRKGGYGPKDIFSDPNVQPDGYVAQRAFELCRKRLSTFARAPIAIDDHDFSVGLIVARSEGHQSERPWLSADAKTLLMESATLARGLLRGIAALAKAKVNDHASTRQLADELEELAFPAALFDEERLCLACNTGFREYVGPSVEPVGMKLNDLHLTPCALSCLEGGGSQGPFLELANEFQDRGTPSNFSMLWTEIPASDRKAPIVMLTLSDSQRESGTWDRIETALPFDTLARVSPQEPTLRFLRETLGSRPVVRRRRTMSYLTVRSWRKSIKDYQIEALRAVKERPSTEAIEAVAAEVETALVSLIGFGSFSAIVPMPGGSSGLQRSFSVRVGEALARRVDLPVLSALSLEPQRASSHPKQNLRRMKMKLAVAPTAPVLVIDDVATSGQHLEEAVLLLRPSAKSVFAVAWIGGDVAT